MAQIIGLLREHEVHVLIDVERKTAVEALSSLKWYHHQHGFTKDAQLISTVEETLCAQTGDHMLIEREICERLAEKVTKAHELRKAATDRDTVAALQEALQQINVPKGL